MEFYTFGEEQTFQLGFKLGQILPAGTVIGLTGTLGAGKTKFTQGIGSGLGIPADTIVSPTFTLCIPYQGRQLLLHIDTYRIKEPGEIDDLDLDEYQEEGAILVIEWVERYREILPQLDLLVSIELQPDGSRCLQFEFYNTILKEICSKLESGK